MFGGSDGLSWDLGNPDGDVAPNLNPIIPLMGAYAYPTQPVFLPMKGPMSTPGLRGLANHGPLQRRGASPLSR